MIDWYCTDTACDSCCLKLINGIILLKCNKYIFTEEYLEYDIKVLVKVPSKMSKCTMMP